MENSQAYMDLVNRCAKPGEEIIAGLTPYKAHLLHMAVGVSGEAGELIDAVKKAVIYNKPLDYQNVIEELGDLEFYMEGLRSALSISRQQTIDHNHAKLAKRYGTGIYTDAQAQNRADKAN